MTRYYCESYRNFPGWEFDESSDEEARRQAMIRDDLAIVYKESEDGMVVVYEQMEKDRK